MEPPCLAAYPKSTSCQPFIRNVPGKGLSFERNSLSSWNYKVNQPPFIQSLEFSVSCLFVFLYVCVWGGGLRAEVKIRCLPHSLATLLLRRYLSSNPELTDQARLASQGAQGSTASASPRLELQLHYHSAWHFYAGRWG